MNETTYQDTSARIETAMPFQPAEGETAAALEAFHCYFEMPTRSTPYALMLSTLLSNPAPDWGCGSTQDALN